MATSARIASLLANRGGNLYGASGRIRLLSPSSNAIASIAKKTATSELDVMTKRYNAGEVSNDEMRAFLEKTANNPGISETDRADVVSQIKDFDFRIQGDKLTAQYKAAPDGTLQQLQAAQALSNYYKTRASSMQPDTPAYADNMNSAAAYDNRVMDITQTVQKQARTNQRYMLEQKVNQIGSGTSERASAKADMWSQLYQQAIADGDMTAANQYAANYEKEATNAQELSQKEQISGEKEALRNILGELTNSYHDGKITESDYLSMLAEISPRIDATGDYGLINTLNRTTDIIQKNMDKGGLKRGTTANGLPTVLGKNKGGKGGVGGVVTDWDQQDYDYSDSLSKLNKGLREGKIAPEEYKKTLALVVEQRVKDIEAQQSSVQAIAEQNPNAKVMFNGRKTRAADVVEALDKEYQKLESQAGAVLSGRPEDLALVQVPPGEFTSTGNVSKSGKGFVTYELVDAKNLPTDNVGQPLYYSDNTGLFHKGENRKVAISYKDYQKGADRDPARYSQDKKTGQYYYLEPEKTIKVYDPKTNKSIDTAPDKDGIIPSFDSASNMQVQDKRTAELQAKRKKESIQQKAVPTIQSNAGLVDKVTGLVKPSLQTVNPTLAAAVNVGEKVMGAVTPNATAQEPIAPKAPTPIAPKSAQQVGLPQNVQINNPSLQQVKIPTPTAIALPQVKQPALKVAVPAQTPIQKAVSSGQIKGNQPIQAPPKGTTGSGPGKVSLGPIAFFKKVLGIK